MSAVADDDVIADFDFQQLAGANQIARDFDVRLRWRGLAAGMVVHEHDCRGGERDGNFEDLARMHEYRIERPDGHQMVATNATACVEQQDRETFAFGVKLHRGRYLAAPIIRRSLGRVAKLHLLGCRTFTQRHDFPFARLASAAFRFGLEQFGLIHVTLFLAVHPLQRAASGLVTLAGGADGL